MQKYFIILLFISMLFSACNRSTKEITSVPEEKTDTVEKVEKKEAPKPVVLEDYNTFYNHFHTDSVFQMSRIKFPIRGYYTDDMGESVAWNKNNWLMHRATVQTVDTSIYTVKVQKTSNETTEILQIEGSGFKTERKFKRLQGKWYLTFYSDDNY